MFLEVHDIEKSYNKEAIVSELNINLEKHKTLSILGRSGCGKTTMLKMIAGLTPIDQGVIKLDGVRVDEIEASKRNIVYLYQEDLLFPHLSVFENIAFGLRIKKIKDHIVDDRVIEMIENLELQGHGSKMPHQISGGQRQRVAFGRAIITNPALLLLDEPFGSLDAGTRKNMQTLFLRLAKTFNITSLFVTHDLKEAILMGDEIAYMDKGKLKIYKDRSSFINDPETGVLAETEFWKQLKTEQF
ncbi:ABC transporter ATP-binding protein [Portibacter marinus]|uniref:ABC transporter ATP-binding protein n=1 Tax=Portibacter marinus TaxID=2898660 RepID=UPI001F15F4D3|nr:ABC transporter ATP-binding protein [Portibacter marinus]